MKPRKEPMSRSAIVRKTPMPRAGKPLKRGPVKPRKPSASTIIPKPIRDAVLARDEHTCQRCGRYIGNNCGVPYSLQHRRPRKMGGSKLLHTMANLVTLCGTATSPGHCHSAVESNRIAAKDRGWLVPDGVTPEVWPVLRFGEWWEQPGETWSRCDPHPRQVEALGDAA